MKAYIVVGPTKLHPRFFNALDSAVEASDLVIDINVARSKR